MTTYAFRNPSGDIIAMYPEFSVPRPLHALKAERASARLAASSAVAPGAVERRVEEIMRTVVLEVPDEGRPPLPARVVPEGEHGSLPRNASALVALADEAGFVVQALQVGETLVVVEGYRLDPREGFRASWQAGRAKAGTWHEPLRFAMVDDDRPVKVAETSRTALSGYRAAGVDRHHLRQTSSPHGVSVGVTGVIERVREAASAG